MTAGGRGAAGRRSAAAAEPGPAGRRRRSRRPPPPAAGRPGSSGAGGPASAPVGRSDVRGQETRLGKLIYCRFLGRAPLAQLDRASGYEPVPDSPETSTNPGFVGENAIPQRTPGDRKGLSGTETAGSTAGSTSRKFVGHDPGQNPPSPSRASASWDGAASRSRIGSCLPVRSRRSRPRLFHASWFCSARIGLLPTGSTHGAGPPQGAAPPACGIGTETLPAVATEGDRGASGRGHMGADQMMATFRSTTAVDAAAPHGCSVRPRSLETANTAVSHNTHRHHHPLITISTQDPRRATILKMLVEGSSLRSISRVPIPPSTPSSSSRPTPAGHASRSMMSMSATWRRGASRLMRRGRSSTRSPR